MIRNKKDFKDKYIELPQNISEKKFNKIKAKLERLGFDTELLKYYDVVEYPYITMDNDNFKKVAMWNKKHNGSKKDIRNFKYFLSLQEISIKDFLKEDKNYTIDIKSDLNIRLLLSHISTNIKDFGSKVKIEEYEFREDGLYVKGKIKDYNPHLTIAGVEIAYCPQYSNKARKFKTAEEAIKWCYNNPMKEICYEINYSDLKVRGRFNNGVGLLGKQRYFEYILNDGEDNDWRVDEDCFAKNFNSVNKNWLNIRECKETTPTFGLL